ncbi:MAG TPA: glycosyltransferase family A protein [Thermoanaerobaculia bacterium]|nr:glycosyltransferase family A protein [Thermoanaerobaculia bacterium]
MKLSVVIPTYNVSRYITESLQSVLAQLPSDAEVIVVDDGSTDDTAAIAESFGAPVRVIRAAHAGIGATVNRGFAEARGTLIAGIDADDRWLPRKMSRQLAALDADPSLDVVFGHVRQFVSPEVRDPERFAITDEPMPGLHRGTMVLRAAAWHRVGPMETDLILGEFISWYSRAIDADLKMLMLPDVVYERRVHGNNTVIQARDAYGDYLRVVKATLDRRRARARSAT